MNRSLLSRAHCGLFSLAILGALVAAPAFAGPVPPASPPAPPAVSAEPAPEAKFADEMAVGYVLVPVIVRSASGGYRDHLTQADFHLMVDGREAAIESFEPRADAPVSVVFLQDLSGSMDTGGRLAASRRAVRFFLERSLDGDEFAIATFAGGSFTVEVPFTSDLSALSATLDTWQANGTTALNDAIAWMPEISQSGKNPKRFAILITDGIDNASTITPSDAREIVRHAELPVYVLGLDAGDPYVVGDDGKKVYRYADVLNLLAHQTGGRYYPLSSPEDLGKALAAIVDDLRHEYVLGFATGGGRSSYRELKVEVAGKNRSVVFRRGYKGPPPASRRGGSTGG